jgi:hypothetical protein
MPKTILVNDRMQQEYKYTLTAPVGKDFHPDFQPQLTPSEMLELGVFGGRYMTDCTDEFPDDWFTRAKLSHQRNPELNFFGVNASQPLSVWRAKGWIFDDDPRGWFQWYCRYFMGRRIPEEDERQIRRWRLMKRHVAQVQHACMPGDYDCHRKQRQALLHWAYDSHVL